MQAYSKNSIQNTPTTNSLPITVLKHILDEHTVPHFMCDGRLFGAMPFLDANTLEKGFDITDLTGISTSQLKDYLGY